MSKTITDEEIFKEGKEIGHNKAWKKAIAQLPKQFKDNDDFMIQLVNVTVDYGYEIEKEISSKKDAEIQEYRDMFHKERLDWVTKVQIGDSKIQELKSKLEAEYKQGIKEGANGIKAQLLMLKQNSIPKSRVEELKEKSLNLQSLFNEILSITEAIALDLVDNDKSKIPKEVFLKIDEAKKLMTERDLRVVKLEDINKILLGEE